jgi:hypothetical protein
VSKLSVKSKSKSRTNKTQYECWQHVLCKELKYKIKEPLCSNRQPYPNISILPFIFSVPIWHAWCFVGFTVLLQLGEVLVCWILISHLVLPSFVAFSFRQVYYFFAVEWYVHVQVHVFSLLYMLVSMNYM